ncbi:MAG: hypothetical protein QXP70_06140 [Methanomassiliicoccales archaeon]
MAAHSPASTNSRNGKKSDEFPKLIIENCEPSLSPWLLAEYRHSAKIWPNLIFCNVADNEMRRRLSAFSTVVTTDAQQYTGGKGCIILDHQAKTPLTTSDFSRASYIIVGGILGYDRPLGRTSKLITSRFSKIKNFPRHMGKKQLSIDSAVFVARAIMLGSRLEDIEVTQEVEIKWDGTHSSILPYGYPVVDGNLILTPGLMKILRETP